MAGSSPAAAAGSGGQPVCALLPPRYCGGRDMGVMVKITGYTETLAGPDLAVIGGAVR